MSPDISEKRFETDIERCLLRGGPDAYPAAADEGREDEPLFGDFVPGGYHKRKPEDYDREWLSLDCSVRVVDSLDDALKHIEDHGSGHSEAIVTNSYAASRRFLAEADAAAVYVNASTQFTDGAQFGLGAEIGISTQKMHARGPMALRELTSYKWIIFGEGQTRPL